MIRNGEEIAVVSALFSDLSKTNTEAISDLGITPDDDGCVYIQRTITADGKAQTKINGRTVPVSLQKEIGSLLINIHGQHENQTLLNTAKHILYLDKYAADESLLAEYIESYDVMTGIRRSIAEINRDEKEKTRIADLLKYQMADIDAAHLKPNEDDELEERRKRIQNIEKIEKNAKIIYRSLYEGEKGMSACQSIDRSVTAIKQIADILDCSEEFIEKLESFRYEIEDIAVRVNNLTDDDIGDPSAALDKIESRLDAISKLKRKYGSTVAEILNYRIKIAAELEDIEMSDEKIGELTHKLKAAEAEAKKRASALTERRLSAAADLSEKITAELAFLDMSKARFSVEVHPVQLSRFGADEVEFMISTNPGEPMKPLARIASGGELSRVMLAVKSILADRENTETLIFDEIDTGISGKTSHKIGIKLKQTSSEAQVLCVTHSAQKAALAHNHLFISKYERDGRAETEVIQLDEKGRIEEIARIMGGAEITETLKKTAGEMLEAAGNFLIIK
jgi:DNA repair protein RecN (Recombination protein N)